MCIAYGSIGQAVNVCTVCKVFPHAKCPHTREVCRNRKLHPQLDVLYFKNAEAELFNGCGYCKWARTNPPPKLAGYNNPGWPGCCRCPSSNEYKMISAVDWPSVSTVYHIPIPPEIKAVLDSIPGGIPGSRNPNGGSTRTSPTLTRSPPSRPAIPAFDRRNSNSGGSGNSPPSRNATISKASGGGTPPPPSVVTSSSSATLGKSARSPGEKDLPTPPKRLPISIPDTPPKSLQNSPNRKAVDLEGTPPRRSSVSSVRPREQGQTTPKLSTATVAAVSSSPTERKRNFSPPGTVVATSPTIKSSSPPSSTKVPSVVAASIAHRAVPSSASSSSGSSDGGSDSSLGSLSDNTVTSDGGFTDYLSDESEAELQRQAEARAALVAQNAAEENEFKAARLRLQHVDLHPPRSWNATNIVNTTGGAK